MNFKVGQVVELIDNSGMFASLGATAVVTKSNYSWYNYELISIVWKTNFSNQRNGGYESYHFKLFSRKNEQLLFSFMV